MNEHINFNIELFYYVCNFPAPQKPGMRETERTFFLTRPHFHKGNSCDGERTNPAGDHHGNLGGPTYDGANPIFNNRRCPKFALILLNARRVIASCIFQGRPRTAFSHCVPPARRGNLGFYTSGHSSPDLICNSIRRTDWLEITSAPNDRIFFIASVYPPSR